MQQRTYLVVYGRTRKKETFRPSDWADRIKDLHEVFGINNANCRSLIFTAIVDDTRCLKVNTKLQTQNSQYWDYIVKFVQEHDLETLTVIESVPSKKEILVDRARCLYSSWIEKLSAAVSRPNPR